jgi:hypothetical protein
MTSYIYIQQERGFVARKQKSMKLSNGFASMRIILLRSDCDRLGILGKWGYMYSM